MQVARMVLYFRGMNLCWLFHGEHAQSSDFRDIFTGTVVIRLAVFSLTSVIYRGSYVARVKGAPISPTSRTNDNLSTNSANWHAEQAFCQVYQDDGKKYRIAVMPSPKVLRHYNLSRVTANGARATFPNHSWNWGRIFVMQCANCRSVIVPAGATRHVVRGIQYLSLVLTFHCEWSNGFSIYLVHLSTPAILVAFCAPTFFYHSLGNTFFTTVMSDQFDLFGNFHFPSAHPLTVLYRLVFLVTKNNCMKWWFSTIRDLTKNF